jgi:glycosyltransferase involved in cell wall biosynthesis
MGTLFVTGTWPDPLESFTHGVAQRMRLLLRGAARADSSLDLLAYSPWNQSPDLEAGERLREGFRLLWGVRLRRVFVAPSQPVADRNDSLWHGYIKPMLNMRYQPQYARLSGLEPMRALQSALDASQPDRLLVHRLAAMPPVLALMSGRCQVPPILLDLDDIEHKAFERLIEMPPHWRAKRLRRAWLPALRRGEQRAVRAAGIALVCSDLDRQYLRHRWAVDNVEVIPNALTVAITSPVPATKTALFLGMHSYEPNRVGAEFLIHQIWPKVHALHPDALLVIAGKHCELIRGHRQPPAGVRFEGFVADLAGLYASTRVVCAPILSGGGTRIKLIEGALHARPLVATSIGAEGLDLSPERGEIVLADTAESFARSLSDLFDDESRCRRMGALARHRAMTRYDEDTVQARVAMHLNTLGG